MRVPRKKGLFPPPFSEVHMRAGIVVDAVMGPMPPKMNTPRVKPGMFTCHKQAGIPSLSDKDFTRTTRTSSPPQADGYRCPHGSTDYR